MISGQEYIIEINDCAMGLMGEGQDEDRRLIAEIVIKEMETRCKVPEEVEKEAAPAPASSEAAGSSRPESVQSNLSKKTEPETEKKEEAKVKKEHKRDKSEEKEARRAEKEARRAEKEAKRERERKREQERLKQAQEEEERRR